MCIYHSWIARGNEHNSQKASSIKTNAINNRECSRPASSALTWSKYIYIYSVHKMLGNTVEIRIFSHIKRKPFLNCNLLAGATPVGVIKFIKNLYRQMYHRSKSLFHTSNRMLFFFSLGFHTTLLIFFVVTHNFKIYKINFWTYKKIKKIHQIFNICLPLSK